MFHAISNVDPSDFTRCYPEGKNKNSSEVGSRAISRDVIPKVKIKIRVRSGAECLRGKPLVRDKINRKNFNFLLGCRNCEEPAGGSHCRPREFTRKNNHYLWMNLEREFELRFA